MQIIKQIPKKSDQDKKLRKIPIKVQLGVQFLLSVSFLVIVATLLMYTMEVNGYFASGNDIWGHLFKSEFMYKSIKEGNLYPLYTELWYNGIQPFRYWAPLPYYLMGALQWIARGNIVKAYYLFAGFSCVVGGIGWLLWGLSTKRMILCTFLGALWFFFPENMRVFFCEGNVPRMVTAILIPYLVYFIWLFVQKDRKSSSLAIIILTSMMAMSHLMISAMMGIATFVFLIFHMIETKKVLRSVEVLISMILGYTIVGIWILPALSGGLAGMDAEASASVLKSLTYSLMSSLNPFNRITGIVDTFYYGIAIIVISIIGIFLFDGKAKAGYYTNLIVLLGTSPIAVPLLSKLPLNQLLWIMRFSTIAYGFFLWSVIECKNVRRYFIVILMSILLIDCLPSFVISNYYTQMAGRINDELEIAQDITNQRVSILDLSAYGSYPSYQLSKGNNPIQYSFGWAWQGASTSSNIVMLNTALEKGNYEYLFDRSIELGDDTVIVRKELVEKANKTKEYLIASAEESGYSLHKETNQTYILHRDMPESFGVQTKYIGIGIGKYAGLIVLPYPSFTVGVSDNIEDYSLEELLQYDTLFLSGFEYDDRIKAEHMVTSLAEQGVKVVIDMTHIPVIKKDNRMYFLGVVSQDISFLYRYPTFSYKGKQSYGIDFPEEYETWNTKYIEGVTNILGSAEYFDHQLTFIGTNENKNIVFTGFNLLFYGIQTEDQDVFQIMSDLFGTELYQLPERTIIPMEISYYTNKIVIDTPVTDVNTTIAFQDNFVSLDGIKNQNNLLFVTKDHTEIQLVYPYYKEGLILTLVGLAAASIWIALIYIIDKKRLTNLGSLL